MSHKQNRIDRSDHDPLDAVLLAEFNSDEQLQPSSGFVLSVMGAIQEEAAAPPPIPFPWRRILPSVLATLCALAAFLTFANLQSSPVGHQSSNISFPVFGSMNTPFSWVALAIALTFIAVSASFRLANRR